MSRALLQLQQDFEASDEEEEATTSAAEGALDDEATLQAGLRAELDGLAAAKEHVISLRRLSDQACRLLCICCVCAGCLLCVSALCRCAQLCSVWPGL